MKTMVYTKYGSPDVLQLRTCLEIVVGEAIGVLLVDDGPRIAGGYDGLIRMETRETEMCHGALG